MKVQNLPQKGDKLYLMHKEIIVTNAYETFQLVQIHYTEEPMEFVVDMNALSNTPQYISSISIELFRRNRDE